VPIQCPTCMMPSGGSLVEVRKAASGKIAGAGDAAERLHQRRTTCQNKIRRYNLSRAGCSQRQIRMRARHLLDKILDPSLGGQARNSKLSHLVLECSAFQAQPFGCASLSGNFAGCSSERLNNCLALCFFKSRTAG